MFNAARTCGTVYKLATAGYNHSGYKGLKCLAIKSSITKTSAESTIICIPQHIVSKRLKLFICQNIT